MAQLADKVALVTGASRGIGRAIAVELGRAGAKVALAARNQQHLEETVQLVNQAGGQGLAVQTNLAEEDSIKNLVRTTQKEFAGLDILINNAGIVYAGPLENTPTDQYDQVMAVNARAPFILCREALPLLKQSTQPTIINISSVVGIKGYPNQTLYTASKHALRGMSIALAEELRKDNIRVHVICPGGVATDMVSQVRPDIAQQDLMAPEEIADLVLYLLTHKGNAVIDELRIRRATSSPWF
ncbi:MAG: SDR family oxidoreductase [Sedimentisphaerales bacterium]|nr:SDR family oxidoreductase [Sedimentisphaerales bacterium]